MYGNSTFHDKALRADLLLIRDSVYVLPLYGAIRRLSLVCSAQASGEETAGLSNTVNAVTFGALTVGGFFTGIICNYIGVRWTLVIGTLGYAPYAGQSPGS